MSICLASYLSKLLHTYSKVKPPKDVRLELARFLFWFMFGPSVHIADDAFGFLISDGVRRAYTSSARINSAFM